MADLASKTNLFQSIRQVFSGHLGDMTPPSGKVPDQVRFFELSKNVMGKKAPFSLTNCGWVAVADWDEVRKKLKDVKLNGFPNGNSPKFDSKQPKGFRERTSLSIRAPELSIPSTPSEPRTSEHSNYCIFVIKLLQPTGAACAKWRFSSIHAPFSYGEIDETTKEVLSDSKLIYFQNADDPKLFKPQSKELLPGRTYPEATWACFLFDGKTARERDQTGREEYVYRYNIHVEIEGDEHGNFIPIIIDPDIGHPGGNYPS